MRVAQSLRSKLQAAFEPTLLEIEDESHRHAGHVGARPEGETHFRVVIESSRFAGVGRVDRQRAVYAAVADELAGPVHALALTARAPGENTSR